MLDFNYQLYLPFQGFFIWNQLHRVWLTIVLEYYFLVLFKSLTSVLVSVSRFPPIYYRDYLSQRYKETHADLRVYGKQ
jgi:hypothetical protein